MTVKTFQDLITEVHEKGICQECGGCVSFCSSAEYDIIGFTKPYSPPEYINEDQCLECGICYYICPQTHISDKDLNREYNFSNFSSMPMGFVEQIYSCQATDPEFLENGSDGGVVNSIINYMIENKLIDGSIVSKMDAPFSRKAIFVDNKEDLIKSSGTKLDISSHLDAIQKFCTYTRSIHKLNQYKFKKLGVVGTPCQIYTIRSMQSLGVTPSENIEFCLGLFCYENFLFDRTQIRKFEKDFYIKLEDIKKINIKEDVILKLKSKGIGDKTIHIPFSHLADYMRNACRACKDLTNIYSDISFGGLGSPEKYTTVIPRTEKGKQLFNKIRNEKVITCLELDPIKKKTMKEIIIHMSQLKIKRYEDFVNLI